MQFTRLLGGLLLATLMAACGGGGGSPGATTGSSSNVTPTIAVELVNAQGAPITTVRSGQSAFARATVRDAAGGLVSGAVVTFSTTDGLVAFFPVSGTALTDATGVASVQVLPASASSAGAGTINANTEVAGVKNSKPGIVTVQVTGGTLPTISLDLVVGSTGLSTTTVGALTPVFARAKIRDSAGAPVSGIVVTFGADQALARFDPASGTGLTDSNGLASVQVLPASATSAGAGVLTADAVVGGQAVKQATLSFQVPQGAAVDPLTAKVTNFVLLLDRSTLKNNGVDTAKLTVVAVDANNNVAPGAKVNVATDANTVFTPSAAVADSQGQYTGQIGIGGDKSDRQVTVTVTVNGITKSTTLLIVGSKLTLQAAPPTPAPGQTVALTTTLVDSASNPIAGAIVTLGGTIPALQGQTLTTDFKGSAAKSFTAPTTAGIYTITASGSGVNAADYQLQVFTNVVPAAVIPAGVSPSLSASPNVLAVNSPGSTTSQSTLRLLFLDGANRPIPNVRVRFADLTVGLAAVGASISSGGTTLLHRPVGNRHSPVHRRPELEPDQRRDRASLLLGHRFHIEHRLPGSSQGDTDHRGSGAGRIDWR